MKDFAQLRANMVDRHIAGRGISDQAILEAFRTVPREEFVGPEDAADAYGDHPLPIGCDQTISQPYIVALMIEAAGIGPGQRVLEVGAGSGFAAAVIGQLAADVVAIERKPELAAAARARLARLGYSNVEIVEGDGSRGCPSRAPFDAILVAASGSHVPQSLIEQLAPGARLIMPLGGQLWAQKLVRLTRLADGRTERETLCKVRFVPLIGDHAWRE
jgi:protein-L-isoaspartate(D-aspartate) O-methyltransferase